MCCNVFDAADFADDVRGLFMFYRVVFVTTTCAHQFFSPHLTLFVSSRYIVKSFYIDECWFFWLKDVRSCCSWLSSRQRGLWDNVRILAVNLAWVADLLKQSRRAPCRSPFVGMVGLGVSDCGQPPLSSTSEERRQSPIATNLLFIFLLESPELFTPRRLRSRYWHWQLTGCLVLVEHVLIDIFVFFMRCKYM